MPREPATTSTLVTINPDEWVAAVQQAWRQTGHRLTEPRNRVLRSIVAYRVPFSAEQLYADLQAQHPRTGRATVYRTLEQLWSERWLVRLHIGHAESSYALTWPGHLHHLICTSCGKVVAFQGCVLGEMIATLAQKTDFAIQGHLLELYGRCTACQTTGPPPDDLAPAE